MFALELALVFIACLVVFAFLVGYMKDKTARLTKSIFSWEIWKISSNTKFSFFRFNDKTAIQTQQQSSPTTRLDVVMLNNTVGYDQTFLSALPNYEQAIAAKTMSDLHIAEIV